MIQDLIDFLKSRVFFINLALMLLLFFGIVFGTQAYLEHYTLHGESITIPEVKGNDLKEASKILEQRGLNVVLKDSINTDDAEPGQVIDQNPEVGKKVKKGRNIYLTIEAEGHEMVSVPDLKDRSRRHALSLLRTIGLGVKGYEFKPDICADCVLEQRYEGETISPDEKIPKGSKLTLVLGKGKKDNKTRVPDLSGLTINKARQRLLDNILKLGEVSYDDACCPTKEDSLNAKVYRQSPSASENMSISKGASVDIAVTSDTSKVRSARKRTSNDEGDETEDSNSS